MNIPFEAIEREKLTGDLNGDNKIDVFDSLIIQKHAAGTQTLSEEQLALADVLNYSNKAVSKWERGISRPEVTILSDLLAGKCEK